MNSCPSPDILYSSGLEKVEKKYGDLAGRIEMVELHRGQNGLGISLAGNKDRRKMSVFVCGLHPSGSAYKQGQLQVGDEILEVNGMELYGRCHLNASATIKSLPGPVFKIIILRREGALNEMAVKPLTQFPVHLQEEVIEEKYSKFTGVRTITVRKNVSGGLGIMIVEGRHQELGKGVFISDIQPGSAAEQSGLAVGDMILCVNQVDLVGSDYETAATCLKNAEGLITIIVAKPSKTCLPSCTSSNVPSTSTTPEPALSHHSRSSSSSAAHIQPTTSQSILEDITSTANIATIGDTNNSSCNLKKKPSDSSLPSSSTILSSPYDVITVELNRKPGKGLGLSLCSGSKSSSSISTSSDHIFISRIIRGGAADHLHSGSSVHHPSSSSNLLRGDQILEVNGRNLSQMSFQDAALFLKTSLGNVNMKIKRFKNNPPKGMHPHHPTVSFETEVSATRTGAAERIVVRDDNSSAATCDLGSVGSSSKTSGS